MGVRSVAEAAEEIERMDRDIGELKVRVEIITKQVEKLETQVGRMIYLAWGAVVGAAILALVNQIVELLAQ